VVGANTEKLAKARPDVKIVWDGGSIAPA